MTSIQYIFSLEIPEYGKLGSTREYLRNKIIYVTEEKVEEVIDLYAITKEIIYGRIKSFKTRLLHHKLMNNSC